jgi:hypothetical protein
MSYYQENRPAMGGLADALAMQGRRGDSTLVHMNPMEVRMLEAMSPDGRLSINPETGLPEAFKLRDILGVALPIAGAALLGPAIAPALGVSGLTGAAIGTGIGGFGAGLAQGKNFKESLVQGGISGLMSYGLGSLSGAFAPSGGVTAAPAAQQTAGMGYEALGAVPTNVQTAANLAPTTAAAEPTGLFSQLREFAGTQAFPETIGSVFPESYAAASMSGQAPTYGSMLGSGLSGAMAAPVGQGLGLMAPEEMPYDIAGMDDMDAYYSRVPDLKLGRLRGQAAARSLNYPPSGSTGSQYYGMATSPGGFGTFLAADGGQVPKPYGDPYGPGDPYGGMADESDVGQSSSTGPGMSLGSFDEPVADLGLGSFNPTPMSLGLTALGMVPGPVGIMANIANLGRGLVGLVGPSVPGQVSGFGTTQGGPTGIGVDTSGKGIDPSFEAVSNPDFDMQFDFNPSIGDPTGVSGDTSGASDTASTAGAVGDAAGESTADAGGWAQGGVVQAGIGGLLKALSPAALAADTMGVVDVDKMKLGDMLQVVSPAAFFAKDPKRLKYLSPAAMAAERPSALSPAATVMMNRGMAQGGVVRRQDGGDLTADDLYGEATVTGIERRLPTQQFVPSQSRGVQESLASMFPNFTVAPVNQIQQSGMTLADVGRLKELMKSGPAAFRLLGMIGMAQGGGISSLAYGGEAAPVGFANKAFEGMVPGQGTGMSDDVPFSIEGNQPALLSRDEYVLPADVVSQLGDGSSSAGADMLDNFISQVRQTKYGNTQQPAPVGPQLMTGLMKQGGVV